MTDPLTALDVYEDLVSLDGTLRELRRRADDQETQYASLSAAQRLADLKLPTGIEQLRFHKSK
jgi:hypothetical protein